MTKKKKIRSTKSTSSKSSDGFSSVVNNEKTNFTLGVLVAATTIFIIFSFISYFKTGAEDQSLVLNPMPGDMLNSGREFMNTCGSWGAYISHFFIAVCFGLPAFMIPIFGFVVAAKAMGLAKVNLWKWFFSFVVILIWSSVAFAKFVNPFLVDQIYNAGGAHGEFVCQTLENVVGTPGLSAVLIVTAIFFLTYLSTETITIIRRALNPIGYITNRVKFNVENMGPNGEVLAPDAENNVGETPINSDDEMVYDDPASQTIDFNGPGGTANVVDNGYQTEGDNANIKPQKANGEVDLEINTGIEEEKAGGEITEDAEPISPYDPKATLSRYQYPTLDLLKKYDSDGKSYINMNEQNANKNRIVQVLGNFGVIVDSIKATVGPTITLYEITLAPGIKISKVRSLEDDIALSLAALGIRIIAPIPGHGTIGIEVPNANPQIVSMESILNSKKFRESKMALPIALGKTISNEIYMVDLAKIPHLLVAGATGQGKSVGLNAIITSLLYKKHPSELKLVLVDPKMVEFSIYKPLINHFLAQIPPESDADEPIITDVTKVVKTLNSLCQEMDDRYNLLKFANVRKLEEYNEKFINRQLSPEHGHRYLPYIVVIIDEYGDLIMTAGKEIELPIARIAQKARAVGIHMIIATQRPTTNIITGTIKANFPGRMAFKVMSQIDSRTILDGSGANQLIGRGDMLILDKGASVRVQCAFVDTPEVVAINEFIAKQPGYGGPFELPEPITEDDGNGGNAESLESLDQLFGEAARVIVMSQQGSTSLIQRKFSIGYNRAGRLMDQLEKAGVVGAAHGSKPREVLIKDENTLRSLLNTLGQN